jgi:hypothetical protein
VLADAHAKPAPLELGNTAREPPRHARRSR